MWPAERSWGAQPANTTSDTSALFAGRVLEVQRLGNALVLRARERRGGRGQKNNRHGGHESDLGEHCRISCWRARTSLVRADIYVAARQAVNQPDVPPIDRRNE